MAIIHFHDHDATLSQDHFIPICNFSSTAVGLRSCIALKMSIVVLFVNSLPTCQHVTENKLLVFLIIESISQTALCLVYQPY